MAKWGERPKEKSSFLKLKDGESVVGVFYGDPVEYYSKEVDKQSVPCYPDSEGAKFRFKINFITKENGQYVAKIWQQGAKIHKALEELDKEFTLSDTVVKVTRKGEKLNTEYTILPNGKNFAVTPELRNILENTQLHDLTKGTKPIADGSELSGQDHNDLDHHLNSSPPPDADFNQDEVPF